MPRPKKESLKLAPSDLVKEVNKVTIRNLSLQGLELCFNNSGKLGTAWLAPRQEHRIPRSYISSQILNLQERRMIRIS